MTRTAPLSSISTFSGTSRPWATPRVVGGRDRAATSETIQAARRGAERALVGDQDVEGACPSPTR